jgi:eukaryotic-like serine/threonine-protein kinase
MAIHVVKWRLRPGSDAWRRTVCRDLVTFMATPDANTLAQQAVQLGLLSESVLREVRIEMEETGIEPDQLLRTLERKGLLTPWQTQKLAKGDVDGYFLGGYRLLYRIKSGSFGRVFRADDPNTGVVVAIKVLRRRWSEQQRTIDLFEREGKVGLSLHHVNIVRVLAVDFDRASHQYYIVMEFVEGGNLKDFLTIRKKLEPAEALPLLEEAVNGLKYAYSLGVTHRDIKPSNILISTQGTAKLVDFGLADIYSEEVPEDGNKVYRTVDYAGLEKATNVKSGDVRSDIYFLGCVLYEMLTGESPLVLTADLKARMKKERFQSALRLSARNGQLPPSLVHLVETMMALNPQHRYQTPSQLLEAVREVRHDIGAFSSSEPAKPRERSVFVVEKNRRLQDALREEFKKLGYRVFLSTDSGVALTRFRHKPFDAILLDAGSAGRESLRPFEQILSEAGRKSRLCVGILLLSEDQAEWAKLIPNNPAVTVMVRPVTLGQVTGKLCELVPPRG